MVGGWSGDDKYKKVITFFEEKSRVTPMGARRHGQEGEML